MHLYVYVIRNLKSLHVLWCNCSICFSHLLKFTIYNQIPKHQVNMAKKRVETTGFRILMISKTVVTQTLLVMNHIYNKFTTLPNRMSIIKFQGFYHGHYPMKSIMAILIYEESQFCTFFILTGAVKTKLATRNCPKAIYFWLKLLLLVVQGF